MSQDTQNTQDQEEKNKIVRPSGENFSFDIVLAMEYGIEEALLIRHFQHWVRVNKNKKVSETFKDGRNWTYQTFKDIADHFPFLNERQVRYAIENLEKKGVIKIGNFNKLAIDKTHWYAFVNEDVFVPDLQQNSKDVYERQNCQSIDKIVSPRDKIVKAIPDTKTTDTKSSDLIDYVEILDFDGKNRTITKEDIHFIKSKFSKDWTVPEIELAYKRLAKHKQPVRDLTSFISAIIDKERVLKRVKNNTKGKKKCQEIKKQETYVSYQTPKKKRSESSNLTTSGEDTSVLPFVKWKETLMPSKILSNG